jgi:hypothetical protein
MLEGTGKVWVSNLKFDLVGNDVPTTSTFNAYPHTPINLELKAR